MAMPLRRLHDRMEDEDSSRLEPTTADWMRELYTQMLSIERYCEGDSLLWMHEDAPNFATCGARYWGYGDAACGLYMTALKTAQPAYSRLSAAQKNGFETEVRQRIETQLGLQYAKTQDELVGVLAAHKFDPDLLAFNSERVLAGAIVLETLDDIANGSLLSFGRGNTSL